MRCEPVILRYTPRGEDRCWRVVLREPKGRDELAVEGVDTAGALALIDRLAQDDAPEAASLCAADRDALLSALCRRLWGDRILSSLTCPGCGDPFDLSFELSELQRHLYATDAEWSPTGELRLNDARGRTRQIPSGSQEIEAAERGATDGEAALAALCGDEQGNLGELAQDLESAAPILDLELDAACPECGQAQSVQFDIQSWVLGRLLGERGRLLGDIHALGRAYGWSLTDILDLPRSTRRTLAGLNEGAGTNPREYVG